MHLADLTLFFAPHSGGVKRYLLAKRAYFATQAHVRHSLLVPGPQTRESASGLFEIASAAIPFGAGYRLPLCMRPWADRLATLRPDVIEVADPYQLAWMALRVADRLGVPAVAFAHSDLARLLGDRIAPALGRAAGAYVRRLYRRFDLVLAPSRLIAERLADLGVAHVGVQPLGVDGDVFHPSRADANLRAELGLDADKRLLVFAGRMAREKDVPLLLRTFARLGAPYHLLLVGGERREALSANVTMWPYQQDSLQLARLLASADALIHAGRHETFGMIIIEAMACGLPVIAVRAGAVTELVGAPTGIVAEPDNVDSLVDAVHALYAGDRFAMGALARTRIERDYLWAHTLPRQLQRYADLVHPTPPPRHAARDIEPIET
jgi:alpha-1,6-mannosyltransferase